MTTNTNLPKRSWRWREANSVCEARSSATTTGCRAAYRLSRKARLAGVARPKCTGSREATLAMERCEMCPYAPLMATQYAFRMRAYAAAHLAFGETLKLHWPHADAFVLSEYTGGNNGRAYAVTLFSEVRGQADSTEEAQTRLSGTIGNVLPLIATAANAAIDDPLAVAAFGTDLSEPRDFIWYATPRADEWFPPGLRRIDVSATVAFMAAVASHPQTGLLHRATETYRRALSNWIPERRLMAAEFLYIAAETLSRCVIETRSQERGVTPKALARLEGAEKPDVLRTRYLKDEIFGGDREAFEAMKTASDGFEHGYMAVEEVRGLVEGVLERSMAAVRRAMIRAATVGEPAERTLLGPDFEQPRGLSPAIHVITGQLAQQKPGPPVDLGQLDAEVHVDPPRVVPAPEGRVDVQFQAHLTTPRLPKNLELRVSGVGVRAAHGKLAVDVPPEVEVNRAPSFKHEDQSEP